MILNKKTLCVTIVFVYALALTGCTSLHAYMYVLAKDYDGNAVLESEENVKRALEEIIENADRYTIRAYERTAISYKVKKTKTTTHGFYVVEREGEKYQTLSFSATGKWATSEGAWTINTESDISSYDDYLFGENKWRVEEIKTEGGINLLETMIKVKAKIESDVTYYYRSKIDENDKTDNCLSALLETMAKN